MVRNLLLGVGLVLFVSAVAWLTVHEVGGWRECLAAGLDSLSCLRGTSG